MDQREDGENRKVVYGIQIEAGAGIGAESVGDDLNNPDQNSGNWNDIWKVDSCCYIGDNIYNGNCLKCQMKNLDHSQSNDCKIQTNGNNPSVEQVFDILVYSYFDKNLYLCYRGALNCYYDIYKDHWNKSVQLQNGFENIKTDHQIVYIAHRALQENHRKILMNEFDLHLNKDFYRGYCLIENQMNWKHSHHTSLNWY